MYFENKDGLFDGVAARIGFAEFSKTGRSIFYRGKTFASIGGRGVFGNFIDTGTNEEYWISGVKSRGSNTHHNSGISVVIDDHALAEFQLIKGQ